MDGSLGEPGDYDAIKNLRQKGCGGIGGLSELRYEHPSKPRATTRAFDNQGLLQVEYGYDAGGNVVACVSGDVSGDVLSAFPLRRVALASRAEPDRMEPSRRLRLGVGVGRVGPLARRAEPGSVTAFQAGGL